MHALKAKRSFDSITIEEIAGVTSRPAPPTPAQKVDHAAAMLEYAKQDRIAAQKKVLELIKIEAQAALAYRVAVNVALNDKS